MFKRIFDIVGALVLLAVTGPAFLLVMLAVRLDSPGPIFFRQERIGRRGRPFRMWKFRKMHENLPKQGPMLTRRFDPRLTRVGRWLERTKLDELPQLINVLRGEMSLIGPRPEVPKFVDLNDARWQTVLQVRPGIFGSTQLQFRNESELYPEDCEDIEAFYRERILPRKLVSDAQYVARVGVFYDLRLLIGGVLVSVFGAVTMEGLRRRWPQIAMLGVDLVLAVGSFLAGYLFRFHGRLGPLAGDEFWSIIAVVAVSRMAVFVMAGTYRRRLSTITYADLVRIAKCVIGGSAMILIVAASLNLDIPRSVLLIDALFLTALLMGKAYAVNQLLRARIDPQWRLPVWMGIGFVIGGTLVSVGTMTALVTLAEPARLGLLSPTWTAMLLIGAVGIRAYGFVRVSLRRPYPGWAFIVYDGPHLLATSMAGSILLFALDTAMYSQFLNMPTLLFEWLVTVMAMIGINRAMSWQIPPGSGDAPMLPSHRLLVVGTGRGVEAYVACLHHLPIGTPRLVGLIETQSAQVRPQTIDDAPILGPLHELPRLLDAHPVDLVVLLRAFTTEAQREQVVRASHERGIECREMPDLMSAFGQTNAVEPLSSSDHWAIHHRSPLSTSSVS